MVFVVVLLPPVLLCMMLALGRYEEWMMRPPKASPRFVRSGWRIRRAPGAGPARHLSLVREAPPALPHAEDGAEAGPVPEAEPGTRRGSEPGREPEPGPGPAPEPVGEFGATPETTAQTELLGATERSADAA